jgi:hypothetical protein
MKKWYLSLLLLAACQPMLIVVGSPYQRYDHNRTQPVSMPSKGSTLVANEAYIPVGSNDFPRLVANVPSTDGLPVANLVPVFTGVPLPLASALVSSGRSDQDDLLDYLGSGPEGEHGVEPPSTAGELTEITKAEYKKVIELLTSKELLRSKEQIIKWAKNSDIPKKHLVSKWVDPRYLSISFEEALAVQYKEFWFLLYRLPERESFSRLVVIPIPIKEQDFCRKGATCQQ